MTIRNFAKFNSKVYAFADTKVITSDGTAISGLTKHDWCDFAELFSKLFVTPGKENDMWVIEGTTARLTTAKTSASAIVKADCCVNHRGLLFVGNLREVDGDHVARIRWSKTGEPENFTPWGAGNYQSFQDVGDLNEPIIRLISFQNDLYIFKQNSIWLASGIASDQVGPETLRNINSTYGLVGPNAITQDERMIKFLSIGAIVAIQGAYNFKQIYQGMYQNLDWRDRSLWGSISITQDIANDRFLMLLPRYNLQNEECYVKGQGDQWTAWKWRRDMSVVKYLPGEKQPHFGDYWNGVYTFDSTKRADFVTNESIDPVFDTSHYDLGGRSNSIRSLQLVTRSEGDYNLTVDVYHDLNLSPHETLTRELNSEDAITDEAVTDVDSTANFDNYIPHFLDLDGNAKKIRLKISATGLYNRFKIHEIKLGYIPRGGI